MASFYAIILVYPIISVLILKLLGIEGSILSQILSEYYLWFAYTIAYIGVIILLFFGVDTVLDVLLAFILYSIGYFAVSVVRKTLFGDYTTAE